jgi:hypothetical protein
MENLVAESATVMSGGKPGGRGVKVIGAHAIHAVMGS